MTEPRSLIVTGAARGLGKAIAEEAARRGYRVGVLDIDGDGARATIGEIAGATAFEASTTDERRISEVLDEFGVPDVWVNNAGIVRFGPLLDITLDDWRAVVEVNLTGTWICARSVGRRMVERGSGSIVNITSMNGVAPGPNGGAYGATKAAVALLTQQMALEWGAHGVRVNAVAPGLIDGGMSESIYADAATRAARTGKVPIGRLGSVDDIASAVLWLASDDASYVTGQNLLVDGGVTMAMIANLPRPQSVDGVGHRPG